MTRTLIPDLEVNQDISDDLHDGLYLQVDTFLTCFAHKTNDAGDNITFHLFHSQKQQQISPFVLNSRN